MNHPFAYRRNDIRYYRRRADLKVCEVARLIGESSPGNVCKWEKGKKQPKLDNVLKLAAALHVPVAFLFRDRYLEAVALVQKRSEVLLAERRWRMTGRRVQCRLTEEDRGRTA